MLDPSGVSNIVVYAWAPLAALDDVTAVRARRRVLANLSRIVRTSTLPGGARPVGTVLDVEARPRDHVVFTGERAPTTPYVLIAAARVAPGPRRAVRFPG